MIGGIFTMSTTISWHFEKHAMGSVNGLQRHNERNSKQHKNERIDPERSQDNINIIEPDMNNKTYQQRIKTRLDEFYTGKRKPRKDAIVDVQHSLQFGGDMFNELSEERRLEVMQSATDFLVERIGGRKNVLDLNYHRDETSDHVHMDTIPLLNDGRLSAKEMYSRKFMKETQSDLLSFMQERFPELEFERADKIGRGFENGRSQADFERLKDKQRSNQELYKEQQKELEEAHKNLKLDKKDQVLDILEIVQPELKVTQDTYDQRRARTRRPKRFVELYGDSPQPLRKPEGRHQLFSWINTDALARHAKEAWNSLKETKQMLADVAINLGVHPAWRDIMIQNGGMIGKTTNGEELNKPFSQLIPEQIQKATATQLKQVNQQMQNRNQGSGRSR